MLEVLLDQLCEHILLLFGSESNCWISLACTTKHVLSHCCNTVFDCLLAATHHAQLLHGFKGSIFSAKMVVAEVEYLV